MRSTLALVVLVPLVVAGCGEGGSAAGGELPEERTFVSTSVTEGEQPRPLVPGSEIRLSFASGELRARAGCNHLRGPAHLDGGALAVDGIESTEIGCEQELSQQDAWLSTFLTSEPSLRLDNGTLVLTSEDTTIELIDREVVEPDQPLHDTRWVVDTVIAGETASSVPAGAEAHMTFDEGGRVSGSTGCNTVSGHFDVDGDRIMVHGLAVTDAACGDDGTGLERAVLDVLDGAPTFTIEADRLTLTADDGQSGLRLRAS